MSEINEAIEAAASAAWDMRIEHFKADLFSRGFKIVPREPTYENVGRRTMIRLSPDTKPVHEWADETFGEPTKCDARMLRAAKEMNELQEAYVFEQSWPEVIDEAADVVISLLADKAVHDAVIRKNRVNQLERAWISNGDGTGRHRKEDEDA